MTANKYRRAVAVVALATVLALGMASTAAAQTANSSVRHSVDVHMRNVLYHFSDSVAVHIRSLDGKFVPTGGELPVFDDKNSFILAIDNAEIAITTESLANVLNSQVFAKPVAPLKGVSIRVDNGKLKIKGKLHSRGDIPFETEGQLTATPDGKIRLHAEHIKALHLPVKGIMDLIGLEASSLVKTDKVQGVKVDGDDFILDPGTLLPAPHIQGRVTAIRLEAGQLVQVFGGTPARGANIPAANYMAFRGNSLRFGKLTMSDTDMALIDMDPKDPFDFYLDHYKEQLVAGYTKETPSFGLRVYMRDYSKLHRAAPPPRAKSAQRGR